MPSDARADQAEDCKHMAQMSVVAATRYFKSNKKKRKKSKTKRGGGKRARKEDSSSSSSEDDSDTSGLFQEVKASVVRSVQKVGVVKIVVLAVYFSIVLISIK